MLNESRIKVYKNAYYVRMEKGESIESIDKSFLESGRLTIEEIKKLHSIMGL